MSAFPDFQPSGNLAANPAVYEVENRAIDPDGVLMATMRRIAPWTGLTLLDLGCGTGFWLAGYLDDAAEVIGVEPDSELLPVAARRDARIAVLPGSAEHIPLPDSSVDVIHARFAYFWPPGCEAGLVEAHRVLRPNGCLVVVDNDHHHGEFAALLARSEWAAPQGRSETTDAWWAARGAERTEVMSQWRFDRRADLEAVLSLEFPADVARSWLDDHPRATALTYGYVVFATWK